MSGGSSVVFWNQSNRKAAFFRGSIVETTRPIRSDRTTRPRWRWVSTQRLGPGDATTIRSWVQRGEPGRVGLRRVRVRQHHVRGRDGLGQELHEAVPGLVREGPGHDHGAEVVQDADLVGKDPLAGSRRSSTGRCNPPGASRAVGVDPARSGAPSLRDPGPATTRGAGGSSSSWSSIEEPDRHVCGQCQRQSSRVARDAREPGLGEGPGIDIDAGAGRRPRCDRHRTTHLQLPFSIRGIQPWRPVGDHAPPRDDSVVALGRGKYRVSTLWSTWNQSLPSGYEGLPLKPVG